MTDLSVTVTERVYPSGEKVYMARFRDPDGRLVRSKVIKDVRTRDQANRKAAQLANSGKIVSKKNNPLVLEYLADFWNENGAYVSSKARQNKPMSPRYVEQSARLVQRHFSQVLKNKRMSQLTPGLIEDAITIMSKSGLSNRSINIAVQTVRVPVAYYARMQNIIDPLRNASKQDETSTPRGVLTLAEVGAIVNLEGEAPRIKAAVLLGALCGLRLGEVRGLQWEDVDFEKRLINVIHRKIPPLSSITKNAMTAPRLRRRYGQDSEECYRESIFQTKISEIETLYFMAYAIASYRFHVPPESLIISFRNLQDTRQPR